MNSPTSINLIPSVLRLFVDPSLTTQEALPKDSYDPIVTVAGHARWGGFPYGLAYHQPKDFQPPRQWSDQPNVVSGDEGKFKRLADEWKRETGHYSLVQQKILHPEYLQIIGMGKNALPFLIKEIQQGSSHWFPALRAIAGSDAPVYEGSSFDEAVETWIRWWNSRRYRYAGMDFTR